MVVGFAALRIATLQKNLLHVSVEEEDRPPTKKCRTQAGDETEMWQFLQNNFPGVNKSFAEYKRVRSSFHRLRDRGLLEPFESHFAEHLNVTSTYGTYIMATQTNNSWILLDVADSNHFIDHLDVLLVGVVDVLWRLGQVSFQHSAHLSHV